VRASADGAFWPSPKSIFSVIAESWSPTLPGGGGNACRTCPPSSAARWSPTGCAKSCRPRPRAGTARSRCRSTRATASRTRDSSTRAHAQSRRTRAKAQAGRTATPPPAISRSRCRPLRWCRCRRPGNA